MADIFDLYVKDNRTIQFNLTEPIMLEDSHVSDWVFHIPRVLNNIDMSSWAWWLVYINAKGQKYSELLELSEDPENPLEKCIATYSVDYGMSIRAGVVRFSLEAINADTQGTILNEWHTQTYQAKVQDTLQGNQVEFAETESDIISALIIEVQNKTAQLVGGATPEPVSLIADMTDTKKVYLYVGSEEDESNGYWYYHNGTRFVPGGLYASGITVDAVPTQGSANAVSSGGVWDELADVKSDLRQKTGLSEDAKIALLACFRHVAWIDEHGQTYYDSLYDALYPDTGLARITAVFEQGTLAVYPETPLNDLKPYLTVTEFYKDGTSGRITDYALSGTLTIGTSTITVTKGGKTATFNVTVTQDPALVYELPSGTDISTHAIDTGVPVFGADDDFTILIKAHVIGLPSDNNTKYIMNHGYLSSGTLRLGVIYNNNLLSYISNVMHSDGTTNITITGETYESDIMYVVRVENKIATKMLYIDGERFVNKTENISSYLSSKEFTGNYMISAFNNTSATDGLFPGTVNLLRIYNKALQDSDIESIMGIQM